MSSIDPAAAQSARFLGQFRAMPACLYLRNFRLLHENKGQAAFEEEAARVEIW